MRDFTLETFTLLLQELKAQDYTFQTFRDFLKTPAARPVTFATKSNGLNARAGTNSCTTSDTMASNNTAITYLKKGGGA